MIYRCFVIIPYDPVYDGVYDAIRAAGTRLLDVQIEFVRADRVALATGIEDNVTQHLSLCDFAIADVSDRNFNVAFEIGYATAMGKPVVIMSSASESVASNLRGRHFLRYDPSHIDQVCEDLPSFIGAALDVGMTNSRKSSFVASGYSTLDSARLPLAIASARREIDVYVAALTTFVSPEMSLGLRRALMSSEELRVRILAMDPESQFVNIRARDLGLNIASYRDELRHAVATMIDLLHDAGDRCELRLFDGLPYYTMYRVDQGLFFSFLHLGKFSRGGLTIRMKQTDPGADSMVSSFTFNWNMAAEAYRMRNPGLHRTSEDVG